MSSRYQTVEEAFWARTRLVDGGHLDWTGYKNDSGTPHFGYEGRFHSALRTAYQIRTGHDPEGPASASCDHPGCVAPEHVIDTPERDRIRAQLAALQGRGHYSDRCRRGHDQLVHGRRRANGKRFCFACVQVRREARRATAAAVAELIGGGAR